MRVLPPSVVMTLLVFFICPLWLAICKQTCEQAIIWLYWLDASKKQKNHWASGEDLVVYLQRVGQGSGNQRGTARLLETSVVGSWMCWGGG